MCGIAGVFYKDRERRPEERDLALMAAMMRHRGPDGYGVLTEPGAGLALARLSIIDLGGGWQPISNEDESVWIVCNGEIFNYLELREELVRKGHRFRTGSDVEVIVHLYEETGFPGLLQKLNGQFSFCIYDSGNGRAFLARDRIGIHPLHYAVLPDRILFASEAKALFVDRSIPRRLDHVALDQVFTFWGPLPGRTLFEGIREVPPAHYLELNLTAWNGPQLNRYWQCAFEGDGEVKERSIESCSEELLERLKKATRIRLRADVPVGAYLSGGLDSSSIASLIVRFMDSEVETFSIGFEDKAFDEESFQQDVIKKLGVRHRRVVCRYDDIAGAMSQVVWHTERPVIRTAAVPMFLLSSLVRKSGYRVVVTGEGADEFLGGYDIFKETLIRNFWSRNPSSRWRSLLLRRLYPYFRQNPSRSDYYLKSFFGKGMENGRSPLFSHGTRWETTSSVKQYYSPEYDVQGSLKDRLEDLGPWIPEEFRNWHPLQRAQYVEISILLSQYLLSSQGDRVAMAHSVEARYPFLDPDVIDFSNQLPPRHKIHGLNEKAVLKKAMRGFLPDSVLKRSKQPYMAPDSDSFFRGEKGKEVVGMYMSEDSLRNGGLFDAAKVRYLLAKCENGRVIGFKDNMSFVGILTAQIFHDLFLAGFDRHIPTEIDPPTLRITR